MNKIKIKIDKNQIKKVVKIKKTVKVIKNRIRIRKDKDRKFGLMVILLIVFWIKAEEYSHILLVTLIPIQIKQVLLMTIRESIFQIWH